MSKVRYGTFFILVVTGLAFISCKKKTTVQQSSSNAVLNLAAATHFTATVYLSGHIKLMSYPGVDTISQNPNVGIRGLIIYRATETEFYVYERACTYDGTTNANAKVYGSTGSYTCVDNVCGSTFMIADGSGQPTHSPATYALKQYKWALDGTGNVLTITN